MELKTLLTADYLDIIFDQRNKKYGGYELRKNYNRRVKKALVLALTAVTALLTFSFISVDHTGKAVIPDKGKVVTPVFYPPPAVLPRVLPHTPPPASAKVVTKSFTATPKITIDKDVPNEKVPLKITGSASDKGLSDATGDAAEISGSGDIPVAGGTAPATAGNTDIHKWVSQMPEFSGDMNRYLSDHLQYPDRAREENKQGPVVVSFVVNEDGKVSNAAVVRSVGGGCDEEALRIISGMPRWKPGKQNGIAVKVWFTLTIRFELQP